MKSDVAAVPGASPSLVENGERRTGQFLIERFCARLDDVLPFMSNGNDFPLPVWVYLGGRLLSSKCGGMAWQLTPASILEADGHFGVIHSPGKISGDVVCEHMGRLIE